MAPALEEKKYERGEPRRARSACGHEGCEAPGRTQHTSMAEKDGLFNPARKA